MGCVNKTEILETNQMKDFTVSIQVNKTPEEVFDAVNNVRAWWGEAIEGDSGHLNDEFTFAHKDIHRSVQNIVELIPGKKVVWLVSDASLNFVEDKTEWKGTQIIFDIVSLDNNTELRFTHHGLIQAFQCYNSCSNAWTFLITDSLKSLIETGTGKPIRKG